MLQFIPPVVMSISTVNKIVHYRAWYIIRPHGAGVAVLAREGVTRVALGGKALSAGMGTKYKSAGAQRATVSHRLQ